MLQTKYMTVLCTGLLCAILYWSCSDIIVPDISDRKVVLVAPADSLITNIQTHKFFWDTMGDAKYYSIRIVTPSFDSVVAVVLDQKIEDNQLDLTLPLGDYEWRVVAVNDAYTSACCNVFRLFIQNDSSADLSNQTILLTAPSDGVCLNIAAMQLDWEPLVDADYYFLQVGNADFSILVSDEKLTSSAYNLLLSVDGEYHWRVRGVNEASLSITAWQKRSFILDQIPPASPDIEFPGFGDTLRLDAQNPDLYWSHASDVMTDTVYIYNNIQRDTLLLKIATDVSEVNLDGSAIDQQDTLEDFYLEVISVDKSGNTSASSGLRRFLIRHP